MSNSTSELKYETFRGEIVSKGACDEALAWLDKNKYSMQDTWQNCPNGEWLYWLVSTFGSEKLRRKFVNEILVPFFLRTEEGKFVESEHEKSELKEDCMFDILDRSSESHVGVIYNLCDAFDPDCGFIDTKTKRSLRGLGLRYANAIRKVIRTFPMSNSRRRLIKKRK